MRPVVPWIPRVLWAGALGLAVWVGTTAQGPPGFDPCSGTPGVTSICGVSGPNVCGEGTLDVETRTTGIDLDPDGYVVNVRAVNTGPFDVDRPMGLNDLERFQVDRAGIYRVELTDVAGHCALTGRNPQNLLVTPDQARPGAPPRALFDIDCGIDVGHGGGQLAATLTWDSTADLDLHLLRGAQTQPQLSDGSAAETDDCHWRNCLGTPDWGPAGAPGDPRLDTDDTDGFGPEVITVDGVEIDQEYFVWVHAWLGSGNATVRIDFGAGTTTCGPHALADDEARLFATIDPDGNGVQCAGGGAGALAPATIRDRGARTAKP